MLHRLKQLWSYLSTIGVNSSHEMIEKSKIAMVNQIIAFSLLIDFSSLLILYFVSTLRVSDCLIILSVSGTKLIYFKLREKQYHQLAPILIFVVITLATFGLTLYYGPLIRVENLYVIAVLYISIVFNDLKKCLLGTFWVILMFGVGRVFYYKKGVLMDPVEYYALLNELELRGNLLFIILMIITVLIVSWFVREVNAMHGKTKEYLDEINDKNASLLKINDEMERFAYIASHDMKTPLRTIISFLGIIEKKVNKREFENLNEYLNYAQDGATQMHHLITDILEYSRLSSSESEKSMVDLNEIFYFVKQQVDPISSQYQILKQSDLPTILANKAKMKTLFQNLIENGLKYNKKDKPTILVNSNETKEEVVLEFIDNGIGIDPEYKNKIFEMFKRLHTSNNYKGTGIGLAICKKIVESMNGLIDLKSNVTEGSVFVIKLPKVIVSNDLP